MSNEFDQLKKHYSDLSDQAHQKGECGGLPGCQICLSNLQRGCRTGKEALAYVLLNLGEVIDNPIPESVVVPVKYLGEDN